MLLLACTVPPESVGALDGQCQDCHPVQAAALDLSAKATATDSAVFAALRAEVEGTAGVASAALCDRCHAPEPGTGRGLSCATCHAAVGHQAPENGLLLHDLRGPVRGPTGRVDPRAPHEVQAGGIANDSALCGTCHDVRGLTGFEEEPYAHWSTGPAAAAGVGCVDCHMSPVPGVDRATLPLVMGAAADLPDLDERALADHRFTGLNGDPAEAAALLARAVAVDVQRALDRVTVTVHNRNPGHDLPDGASYLRELWVEVEDERGLLAEPAWLSTRLTRRGEPVASPALADAQVRGAIPAAGRVDLVLPPAHGAVRACVYYRALRPDLLEHLGLDPDLAGPVWTLACAEAAP